MPLEIKELHIKASVSDETGRSDSAGNSSTAYAEANEELIQACVDKVMEILREKNER